SPAATASPPSTRAPGPSAPRTDARAASGPAQAVQVLVVDPVVVGDLVHEGDVDLAPQLVEIAAEGEQRLAEQHDAVGQLAEAVAVALGEGDPLVEPEQLAAVLGAVLDDEDEILQSVDH